MSDEISDEFHDQFLGHGSIVMDCGCGRTHFTEDRRQGDFDVGELEELQEKAKLDPAHYVSNGDYSVSAVTFAGYNYVLGCPCNYGPKLEKIIWHMRREIAGYLAKRSEAIVKDANETLDALRKASPAVLDKVHARELDL